MNPKARKLNINPCVVCGYKYSDAHHLYPQSDGGKETIYLCPNHHRYANMVQIILKRSGIGGDRKAKEFAERNFDDEFNQKILNYLIGDYYSEACDIAERKEHEEFLADLSPQQREEYERFSLKFKGFIK